MNIRKMIHDDLPVVAELERQIFPDPWNENMLASEIDNPIANFFVCEIDCKIVGYIGSWLIIDECEMGNLCVSEDFRRHGVGSALITNLISEMNCLGAKRITLEVRVSNLGARAFYRKYNFEQVGCRRGYYRNGEDALILGLTL